MLFISEIWELKRVECKRRKAELEENIKQLDDIIKSFNKNDVEYLIVGGTAVHLHGHHRISHNLPLNINFDYDFWYKPTLSNWLKLVKALKVIQPLAGPQLESKVFRPETAYFRITEAPYKIDLLPFISGFKPDDFDEVKSRCFTSTIDIQIANVISYDDLILSKEVQGRSIDHSDILHLKRIKNRK